jgi:hypothetical protein
VRFSRQQIVEISSALGEGKSLVVEYVLGPAAAAFAEAAHICIVKPIDAKGISPAMLYLHGADGFLAAPLLTSELSVGVPAAVVFVDCHRRQRRCRAQP